MMDIFLGADPVPNAPFIRERLTVPKYSLGDRLDQYAAQNLHSLPSRKSAYKAAKRGALLVNGQTVEPSRFVYVNDEIILVESHARPPVYRLSLEVVWEDEWLAIISKPPGIPVNGNYARTIERALPFNLTATRAVDALTNPKPVHRLDAPTGGLLLVAKSAKSLMNLSRLFENGRIRKRYRAIVTGRLQRQSTIRLPVNGKHAETFYTVVEHSRSLRTDWLTTLDLIPVTGRTHQLRQHLAAIGHPIVGDSIYGAKKHVFRGKGLFLWAIELEFDHPESGEKIGITIDEPAKFNAYRGREARRWKKYYG